ncbi:hypothetical protein RRG08_039009 [Elysia crispata]|uniref:Uncharacterized protein n=1 Tax=Elysia crispata TaxID=231223 RepID=A0AAE1AUL4_9GAST|nr:hypothetical protein RRG08_039009 [Elysia crispata]
MATAKTDAPSYTGDPEADADSIEVRNLRIGDTIINEPITLSAEAEVKEEVRRVLQLVEITLDPNQHTFVVTDSDGQHIWLEHGDAIEDKLDDLTGPIYVEIVKFDEQPRGAPPNINELNICRKQ